jgi:8-oxo-dGTP pyrophosphatase MutT (NUDIX family)
MDRFSLVRMFESYTTEFTEEQKFIRPFIELLNHKDSFQRSHLPGHITGSAWIVNKEKTKTLLVHHAKLNKWVQPGGHADGEENILNVALREAEEETGLRNLKPSASIFDVDIHLIPERKEFPEHFHYDIRFLMEGEEEEEILISEESHDVRWINLDELEKFSNERSVLRMKEKLMHMHSVAHG